MHPHLIGPQSPSSDLYWASKPGCTWSSGAADRVWSWRNTTRAPLSPISTNRSPSTYSSEPVTREYPKFGSSTSSNRGWTSLKPYPRPSLDSAPTLAPGEPAPRPLNSLPAPVISSASILHGPIVCSSCDEVLPSMSQLQDPVQLLPCGHAICSTCLTLLINSAANVPPRAVDCFACGAAVETVDGIGFGPEVVPVEPGSGSGYVTPCKRKRDSVGSSGSHSASSLSFGIRTLNLADAYARQTPQTTSTLNSTQR